MRRWAVMVADLAPCGCMAAVMCPRSEVTWCWRDIFADSVLAGGRLLWTTHLTYLSDLEYI